MGILVIKDIIMGTIIGPTTVIHIITTRDIITRLDIVKDIIVPVVTGSIKEVTNITVEDIVITFLGIIKMDIVIKYLGIIIIIIMDIVIKFLGIIMGTIEDINFIVVQAYKAIMVVVSQLANSLVTKDFIKIFG
jgi:hypothetical protein